MIKSEENNRHGKISLSNEILEQIYLHSERCYPEESCGIIFGNNVRECINIQSDLHKKDPEKHPRDGTRGYTMSFEDQIFLNRNIDKFPADSIIYHSHPDVGAYFSDEDYSRAIYNNELIYPVDYLVISVKEARANESILFRFGVNEFDSIGMHSRLIL